MDGDSWPDLVVANYSDATVGIYRGDGAGNFAAPVSYSPGIKPLYLRVADINHDAAADVIVVDRDAHRFSVMLNRGDGSLSPGVITETNASPLDFSVNDFDGDGNLDLAMPEQSGLGFTLYFGIGNGSFPQQQTYANYESMSAASGDVNRDGKPDVVVGGLGGWMSVYLNLKQCE